SPDDRPAPRPGARRAGRRRGRCRAARHPRAHACGRGGDSRRWRRRCLDGGGRAAAPGGGDGMERGRLGRAARRRAGRRPHGLTREVSNRYRDETNGEVRRPVLVDCAYDVAITPELVVWPADGPASASRRFTLAVTNRSRGAATVQVDVTAPRGWHAIPLAGL